MTLRASLSYHPVSDSSAVRLASVDREARGRGATGSEVTVSDRPVMFWRALALFGALLAVEGGMFTMFAAGVGWGGLTVELVTLGVAVFVIGSVIAPVFGGGYGWAVIGAASILVILGFYVHLHPLGGPSPVGSLWTGGTTAHPVVSWTVRGMEAGGLILFVSGLAGSLYSTFREERE